MKRRFGLWLFVVFVCFLLGSINWSRSVILADNPSPNANTYPAYVDLRKLSVSGDSAVANNLVLKRDAGTFTFKSGNFYFLSPVLDKVTGVVFVGEGTFTMTPPLETEKKTLALLTKEPTITEEFSQLVLRFTDDTYAEIKKQTNIVTGTPNGQAADIIKDNQNTTRRKMEYNISARILQDVVSGQTGGLFAAFLKGRKYGAGHLLFLIDPWGAPDVEPEEVRLTTHDGNKAGIWAAFHLADEYKTGKATGTQNNEIVQVDKQKLDTEIAKDGRLTGTAITTLVSMIDGARVVPFSLYGTLRVQSVTDMTGQPLPFIQEEKEEGHFLYVVLPKNLLRGERFAIKTSYNGKDVVMGAYVVEEARDRWYPNTRFGKYTQYEMTFRVPKEMTLVATGVPVSQAIEGETNISEWRTEVPQAVAGFNLGKYKKDTFRDEALGFDFESYDYAEKADTKSLQYRDKDGHLESTTVLKKTMAEAKISVAVYTDYFGPLPYRRLALTQQPSGFFGQSWPSLLYLPTSAFNYHFGDSGARGYFRQVGPHEVSHQWWGHAVGFNSYRDQWMSEGFADFSASLFIQGAYTQDQHREYFGFWKDESDLLTERNDKGFRAIDVGPVVEGYRLSTGVAGFDIYRRLIYPKGAYILHMIRMMMSDPKTHDDRFKVMMHDFVKTYLNRSASTEDFKAMVEKYMTPQMDLDNNGKMDWFFNEYVYGTGLPNYKLDYSFSAADGKTMLTLKIAQSKVDDKFEMLVPIYLEFKDGTVHKLGSVPIKGNQVFSQTIPLNGLQEMPKKVLLNHYYDVLCTQ